VNLFHIPTRSGDDVKKEIERWFLPKNGFSPHGMGLKTTKIVQGYLAMSKNSIVRVRTVEEFGYLTIKTNRAPTEDVVENDEFEYMVPLRDAKAMLASCVSTLEKTRHYYEYRGNLWEIDVFEKLNSGLIKIEIEIPNRAHEFEVPDFVGVEVTGIDAYSNYMLSINPYGQWMGDPK